MSDWLISRKRYWGLPLPIWECDCGHLEVFGSLDELKKLAIDKKLIDKLPEIHKPWIDEIKIICPKCKKEVSRIPDVGDAWLDAGIVPFSTLDYIGDKKYWNEWFPADFISENMPGQYRGWFNALFWASVTLTGKAPFKTLFGYESVKDEKGEEMHKSKGNAIWFDDAVEKIGADTMRLLFCMQDPTQELKFGFNVAKEPYGYINILVNLSNLIEKTKTKKYSKPEDKWIMSKLNSLTKTVTEEFENLHLHLATRALKDFWLTDFSRTYIQLVRERLSQDDEEAKYILHEIYLTIIKLAAPIIPFVTEKIWQNLKEKKIVEEESVHLTSWPKYDEKKINKKLEQEFELVLKIIELGLSQRDKAQIGLKWPLPSAKINSTEKISKELEEIIMRQINIKKVEIKIAKEISVELDTKITPELESEGYARELSRSIQAFRKELGLQKTELVETIIIADENFKKIIEKQTRFLSERTNSKKFQIVTTSKETFKNKKEFTVKDKRGWIVIKN
jgi:isoleucyl-tRNA synthetase